MHVREWDLVEYGVKHAKRGTKARGRVPWRYHGGRVGVPGVTLQEVIEEARRLYPDLSIKPATARKWVERGLLPNPETVERLGGREGARAHYGADSPAQLATAAFAAARGYKQREVAQSRALVLQGLRPDSPELERAFAVLAGERDMSEVDHKARRIALAALTYAKALARARGGLPLEARLPEIRCIDRRPVAGDPSFCFYICLPGKVWDGRVTGEERADMEDVWSRLEACGAFTQSAET